MEYLLICSTFCLLLYLTVEFFCLFTVPLALTVRNIRPCIISQSQQHRTMEEYSLSESNIINSVNTLETVLRDSESVEAENKQMLSDLVNLRARISEFAESKTELSGRTRALKDKIHNVDENIKKESDEVKNRIRKYFKNLGIRVDQETMKDMENHIEITINFKEGSNASFSLAYDTVTEDFDCKPNTLLILLPRLSGDNKYPISPFSTINST